MPTLTDDFESLADGAALSTDADWAVGGGSGTGVPTMDQHDDHSDLSQVTDMDAVGDRYAIHQTQVGDDDHYSEMEVFTDSYGSANNVGGPIVRGSTATPGGTLDGYGGWAYLDSAVGGANYQVGIFRIDDGVPTLLTGSGNIYGAGAGQYLSTARHTIRIDVSGSTLTLYVDGNQELQTTDSTYTTGQYTGFRLNRSVSHVDSQPFVDNWTSVPTSTGQTITLGRVTETDVARALTVDNPRTYLLGRATETDVARALTVDNPRTYSIGRVTETDVARSITVDNPRTYSLGRATEVDTARAITVQQDLTSFPSIVDTATFGTLNTETTHNVTMPTGIASGMTLLTVFRLSAGATVTPPAGWSSLGADAGNAHHVFVRTADGTEGATAAFTTSASVRSAVVTYLFNNVVSTEATVSSLADPPSLTPAAGSAKYLWVASYGQLASDWTANAPPTNYENLVQVTGTVSSATSRVKVASATRELEASSEDPGTFTLSGTTSGITTSTAGMEGGSLQTVTLGRATETSAARAITVQQDQSVVLGRVTEVDVARTITAPTDQTIALGRPTETDVARAVTVQQDQSVTLTRATEADVARAITVQQAGTVVLGRVTEVDTARALTAFVSGWQMGFVNGGFLPTGAQSFTLGRVTETDTSRTITVQQDQSMVLGRAVEIDISRPLTLAGIDQSVVLGRVSELDTARSLAVSGGSPPATSRSISGTVVASG